MARSPTIAGVERSAETVVPALEGTPLAAPHLKADLEYLLQPVRAGQAK
jgi:hypothetical protein